MTELPWLPIQQLDLDKLDYERDTLLLWWPNYGVSGPAIVCYRQDGRWVAGIDPGMSLVGEPTHFVRVTGPVVR
jgi:hypothetical protein